MTPPLTAPWYAPQVGDRVTTKDASLWYLDIKYVDALMIGGYDSDGDWVTYAPDAYNWIKMDPEVKPPSELLLVEDWVIYYAIQYGMSRQSYAHEDALRLARKHWDDLNPSLRRLLEVDHQEIRDLSGMIKGAARGGSGVPSDMPNEDELEEALLSTIRGRGA